VARGAGRPGSRGRGDDDGPILAQETVPVLADDTEESLHERIKQVEWRLYPATIRRFVADTFDDASGPEPPTEEEEDT
jgi:phosphoribosylglycinamide formyltransferase 1